MSNAARSVAVFGVYLCVVGLSFFFIPNTLLPPLGFAPTTEVWIRLVGLVTAILGMYFLYAVRFDDRVFFRATIISRLIFPAGVTGLVASGLGKPILLAFALIDLAGAAWTWLALREPVR